MMTGTIQQEDVTYSVASEYVKEGGTPRRPKTLSLLGKAS